LLKGLFGSQEGLCSMEFVCLFVCLLFIIWLLRWLIGWLLGRNKKLKTETLI
jgi:hypothetical protein